MCKCTPEIRTPFCGKSGCEWPTSEQSGPTTAPFGDKVLTGRDDVMQELGQALLSLTYDNYDQAVKEIRTAYEKAVMLRAGLPTTEA